MSSRPMRALLGALIALLTFAGMLAAAPSAVATEDPAELPTVLSPVEGESVVGDFSGPIRIDFSTVQRSSTWVISAASENGCSQPAGTSKCSVSTSVSIDASTRTLDVTLPEPLGRSATYNLQVTESTGGLAVERSFTITGATDDTTPDPDPEPTDLGTVDSPANGSQVNPGYTGPVTVSFPTTNPNATYALEVLDPNGDYLGWRQFSASGGDSRSVTIPALDRVGTYTIRLWNLDTDQVLDQITVRVVKPPLPAPTLIVNGARPETFYPTVRDGFRDTVAVRYRVNQRSTISYRVLNSSDRSVASKTLGLRWPGGQSFTWNGRDRRGNPVDKGRYRIEVTATNTEDASTTAKPIAVVATTDIVTRRGSDSWRGTQTDRRIKRGNCYFRGYAGELTLDCWAGNYARAEYDFRIPANATNVRYRIHGERNCCDLGSIIGSGKRVSPTRVTVALKVTYWRSYTIRRVNLTYQYKARR